MRIAPAIAAMQRDAKLQRRAQARMIAAGGEWRGLPAVASVLTDLAGYGAGLPLTACPALAAVFREGDEATALASSVARHFAAELARNRFGQMPFRHSFDGRVSTLLLARSARAQLILRAREPGAWDYATARFSDAERHDAILAGKGEGALVRRDPRRGGLGASRVALEGGVRHALDLACEALQVSRVSRRLVSLRLHRFAAAPEPSREYRLADGALVHQSAGDIRASRQEMMLALLGRMECVEAAPAMAAIARGPGDASLRWQALRECLALDTAAGFGALCRLARAERDPLAGAADALRARLLEAHPTLHALEGDRCPA